MYHIQELVGSTGFKSNKNRQTVHLAVIKKADPLSRHVFASGVSLGLLVRYFPFFMQRIP